MALYAEGALILPQKCSARTVTPIVEGAVADGYRAAACLRPFCPRPAGEQVARRPVPGARHRRLFWHLPSWSPAGRGA